MGSSLTKDGLEKPREPGARRGGTGGQRLGGWQSWELELQRLVSGVLPLSPQIPNPQLAPQSSTPHTPPWREAELGLRPGTHQVGCLRVSGEEPSELLDVAGSGQGVA